MPKSHSFYINVKLYLANSYTLPEFREVWLKNTKRKSRKIENLSDLLTEVTRLSPLFVSISIIGSRRDNIGGSAGFVTRHWEV